VVLRPPVARCGSERCKLKNEAKLVLLEMPPTMRFVAAYVCAVSRLMISLAQPGTTQREVVGAPNRPEVERWRGKEPVVESGDRQKACTSMRCKLRTLWLELNCPKPNSQGSSCSPIGTMPQADALLGLDSYVRLRPPLQERR